MQEPTKGVTASSSNTYDPIRGRSRDPTTDAPLSLMIMVDYHKPGIATKTRAEVSEQKANHGERSATATLVGAPTANSSSTTATDGGATTSLASAAGAGVRGIHSAHMRVQVTNGVKTPRTLAGPSACAPSGASSFASAQGAY